MLVFFFQIYLKYFIDLLIFVIRMQTSAELDEILEIIDITFTEIYADNMEIMAMRLTDTNLFIRSHVKKDASREDITK